MKLKLDITPDLVAAMAAEVKAREKAVTAAMREAGTGLKTAWRGQITGAGLGRRLANSIRSQTYLPRPRIEISGPQGVQATFDWQAARDSVVGRMCTATLINDIEVY